MELTVLERIMALNLLPKENDITTMRVTHDLRMKLGFTEAEHKALQFQQEGERLRWNDIPNAEIEIGAKGKAILRAELEKASKEKRLTEDHIGLWDKFECVGDSA
jgi:hypothetical protein